MEQQDLGPAVQASSHPPMRIPQGYKRAVCRGCGQIIFWASKVDFEGRVRTRDGRPIRDPINPWPVPDGEIVLRGAGRAENVPITVFHDGERWQSHFRTCPKRDRFRGRGRGRS